MLGEHMHNPFYCEKDKKIKFRWKGTRDIVFIFPEIFFKCYGNNLIAIPEEYQQYYKTGRGIVLTAGPGLCLDSGKIRKNQISAGDFVGFDKNVLWGTTETALDGKDYFVVMCGEQDVRFIIEDCQ